jgi:lysophospholipase L1-like esterase
MFAMKKILLIFAVGVLLIPLLMPLLAGINIVSAAIMRPVSVATATKPMRPAAIKPGATYAALGDSMAAGAGLASAGGDARCVRSTQAYGYKVAQSRQLSLMHIACSGSTAGDLVTQQHIAGPNIPPQLDPAFANGTPNLITITTGANDMLWGDFLRKCATTTCGTKTDEAAANTLRAALKVKLEFDFSEIQRRSNNQPPLVVITGYSNPISNYCKNRQQFATVAEINWLNAQRDKLNLAIREVVAKHSSYVRYASMNFDQHSLCSPNTWWQGLNDPAPLHPNDLGQTAIANSVNRAIGPVGR